MHTAITRNLSRIAVLLPITFVWALLIPFTVMAEPEALSCQAARTKSCQAARTKMKNTRNTLLPLKQQQTQIQQYVRSIYQELFTCQTHTAFTRAQQDHCSQLQDKGPKHFQAMIEAITRSHQISQQLAHYTRQAQLACPGLVENTFSQKTDQSLVQKIC